MRYSTRLEHEAQAASVLAVLRSTRKPTENYSVTHEPTRGRRFETTITDGPVEVILMAHDFTGKKISARVLDPTYMTQQRLDDLTVQNQRVNGKRIYQEV